jgi:hypothetical protein
MKKILIIGMYVVIGLIAGCDEKQNSDDHAGEQKKVDPSVEEQVEPVDPRTEPKPKVKRQTTVSDFFQTHVAEDQILRKDHGQVLLMNGFGDIAIAGVTRSKIDKERTAEPSFAGDMFITRYSTENGWTKFPLQIPVELPEALIFPAPVEGEPGEPKPLPEPLLKVRGGRLFDSGKVMIVGELTETKFSAGQLNIVETAGAKQSIFLTVAGRNDSGVLKSVRYGLSGINTVTDTANSRSEETILMIGSTTSGLLLNETSGFETQTNKISNYIAEIDDSGAIVRHLAWPENDSQERSEHIKALVSDGKTAFVASERRSNTAVFVQSFRLPEYNKIFIDLPSYQVCAEASEGASEVRVASIDYRDNAGSPEVVVAVEISNSTVSQGIILPCIEVFKVRSHGTLTPNRESIYLSKLPSVSGTLNANFVKEGRILMTRSRESVDSQGSGEAIVTFLFERSIEKKEYESSLWKLNRPEEWYENESVNGLKRRVTKVIYPKTDVESDVVWMLSNDLTELDGEIESIVHLGSYRAVPRESSKKEEKND